MYQLSDDKIVLADVPKNIRDCAGAGPPTDASLDGKEKTVLQAVAYFNGNDLAAGRKNIYEHLLAGGGKIAEQDIRFILKSLEVKGLVEVHKGRRGTRITAAGRQYLRKK